MKFVFVLSVGAAVAVTAGCPVAGTGPVNGAGSLASPSVPAAAPEAGAGAMGAVSDAASGAGPEAPPPGDVVSDTPPPVGMPAGPKYGDPHACTGVLVFEEGPTLTASGPSENGVQPVSVRGVLMRRQHKVSDPSQYGDIVLLAGTAVTALLEDPSTGQSYSVTSVPADLLHFQADLNLPEVVAGKACLRLTVYRAECSEYPQSADGFIAYFGPVFLSVGQEDGPETQNSQCFRDSLRTLGRGNFKGDK